MTKKELIVQISKDANLTTEEAERALNAIIGAISASLIKGEAVTIVGFGTFSISSRAAREGRNPRTGSTIRLPHKRIVKFKASKNLMGHSNGDTDHTGPRGPRKI